MTTYKITDLENLSGIKSHTIRTWEQRYHLFTPIRTKGNSRLYNDEQLKKLLNVATLIDAGYKISTICQFSEEEFRIKLESIYAVGATSLQEEVLVNELIISGLTYDEAVFDQAFAAAVLKFGLIDAYSKVLYPMLKIAGFLWSTSYLDTTHEHFIANLIRQKLFASIDNLPLASKLDQKWLLFLPRGHYHEIGLLVANYQLKRRGIKTYSLGTNTPIDNLGQAVSTIEATHLLFFVVKSQPIKELQKYIDDLYHKFPKQQLYICLLESMKEQLSFQKNQHPITSIEGLSASI